MLGNLIANAVKFSPRGGDVILRVAQRDEAVRVSVTDRGPGVPEAFKPHIFGEFTQADGSTARKFGGTGLGLHICKLIVERHEGRIGFESTPGGDTTFYFEIPSIVALGEPRRLAAE
mgnify:CR=1 FL=1